MFQAPLPALVLLLQVSFTPVPSPTAEELGLPPQYDLDLPVEKETYDPDFRPPAPAPRGDEGDPRDEPPPVFFGEEISTESDSLIYVLDFSGSMKLEGRADAVKAEFKRSVSGLPEAFRFNVVVFACYVAKWQSSVLPASPAHKAAAIAWVEEQVPFGMTATGPATATALEDKANLAVVLLTDGDPNCGAVDRDAHRQMIRHSNTQGAAITVFGIAAEGEYRRFCQYVAADSGGSYFDLPTTATATK